MNKKLLFNIQFFAEENSEGTETPPTTENLSNVEEANEDKKLSQSEIDAIIQNRLVRERKKWESDKQKEIEELVKKKVEEKETFEKMTEEERIKAEYQKAKEDLEADKAEFEKRKRELILKESQAEIRSAWAKDKLPEFDGMDVLVEVLANQNDDTKASCYNALKRFSETTKAKVRKDEFNQDTPRNGGVSKISRGSRLAEEKNKEVIARNSGKPWGGSK